MKTKVKLGLAKMSVPQLRVYANHVVSKITGNSYFTAPFPDLSKIGDAIKSLVDAHDLAQGAGPAQTAAMNQGREVLQNLLTALGSYVEGIANDPKNADTGADAIILSAGMDLKSVSHHQKQTFSASTGNIPGSVDLTAEAIRRGAHEWQYSTDTSNAGGWISADPTVQASTTLKGLEAGKRYFFRHRSITAQGLTDWDDPLSLIVG